MGTDLSGPVGGGWETAGGLRGWGGGGTSTSKDYSWASAIERGLRHFDICPKLEFSCYGLQDSFCLGRGYRGLDDLATAGRISSTFLEGRKAQRFEAKSLLLGVRLQEFYGIWGFCG